METAHSQTLSAQPQVYYDMSGAHSNRSRVSRPNSAARRDHFPTTFFAQPL